MNAIVGAPILLPLVTALVAVAIPRPSTGRRVVVGVAFAAMLGVSLWLAGHVYASGPLVLSWGGWIIPYGIVLVADTLAAVMVSLASLMGLACVLFGYAQTPTQDEHPLRLPLLLLLLAGIQLSFLTGDLFNLFVAFEVFLLASYGLMTLESNAKESRRALPYVTINLVGSALFICACGFAYGLFGTMNFAEIAARSSLMAGDVRVELLGLLLLLVFAIKAGIFPLYYWLPVSYARLPAPIAAFFAGLLTKVGIYILIRIFGTVLPPELTTLHTVIAWAAGLTMVIGGLGAIAQSRIQTILSYHIASQVGYMALAIGFFSADAFSAAIFFTVHQIVVKAALFLVGGVILRVHGSDDLSRTGGLWTSAPALAIAFLLLAFSLAGIPPLSGFWGKLMIIQAGLSQGEWTLVFLSLVASVLTMLSMLKIWLGAFWKPKPEGVPLTLSASSRGMTAVVGVLALVSVGIGVGANHFVGISDHAARETLDRTAYVETVRGWNLQPEEGKHP